jgi:hypothetical protein
MRQITITLPDTIEITCKHKASGTVIHAVFDTSTTTEQQILAGAVECGRRGFAQNTVRAVSDRERAKLVHEGYKGKFEEQLPGTRYIPERSIQERTDELDREQTIALIAQLQENLKTKNETVN